MRFCADGYSAAWLDFISWTSGVRSLWRPTLNGFSEWNHIEGQVAQNMKQMCLTWLLAVWKNSHGKTWPKSVPPLDRGLKISIHAFFFFLLCMSYCKQHFTGSSQPLPRWQLFLPEPQISLLYKVASQPVLWGAVQRFSRINKDTRCISSFPLQLAYFFFLNQKRCCYHCLEQCNIGST